MVGQKPTGWIKVNGHASVYLICLTCPFWVYINADRAVPFSNSYSTAWSRQNTDEGYKLLKLVKGAILSGTFDVDQCTSAFHFFSANGNFTVKLPLHSASFEDEQHTTALCVFIVMVSERRWWISYSGCIYLNENDTSEAENDTRLIYN